MRAFDLGLISATALHAKRRMGKTEFLTKDVTPKAVERGYVVGYCNLFRKTMTQPRRLPRPSSLARRHGAF
jgi:hypothetical protein